MKVKTWQNVNNKMKAKLILGLKLMIFKSKNEKYHVILANTKSLNKKY